MNTPKLSHPSETDQLVVIKYVHGGQGPFEGFEFLCELEDLLKEKGLGYAEGASNDGHSDKLFFLGPDAGELVNAITPALVEKQGIESVEARLYPSNNATGVGKTVKIK